MVHSKLASMIMDMPKVWVLICIGSGCRKITDEGLNGFLERRSMQYEQYVSKLK